MLVRIGFELSVVCPKPTPMLLALSLFGDKPDAMYGSAEIHTSPETMLEKIPDSFGNRRVRLQAPAGDLTIWSDCVVRDDGMPDAFDWTARQHDVIDLPGETLTYLAASRYCESDELAEEAWALFGATPPGWARVQAISNWVYNNVLFDYRFGRPTKTAVDVFREGTGVCRDFSHLFIALCRAMNIPARYASGYLSDIGTNVDGAGDFCAWSEVFLEGRWHDFDPRHNSPRIGRFLMARGRDAADVPMLLAFGHHALTHLKVWTDLLDEPVRECELVKALEIRPTTDALVLDPSSLDGHGILDPGYLGRPRSVR